MGINVSPNVNLNPVDQKINQDSRIKDNASTTDNVLDLSNKETVANELNSQDVQKIEFVKVSQGVYINLSDPSQKQLLLNQLKSKLLNSSGKLNDNFSAVNFQENTGITLSFKNDAVNTHEVKTKPLSNIKFSLTPEMDIKSSLKTFDFNNTFMKPGSDKSSYVKAEKALQTKITDIDKQLGSIDPASPDKAKLEYMKNLYSSMKDVYTVLSKPNTKESLNNFLNEVKEASEVLNQVSTKLPQQDIANNYDELSKINGVISDFQMISMAFPSLGGKGTNISNRLNEFTAQTYERLAEITGDSKIGKRERKDETKDIKGAIQTFSNDISDMKTFIDRLSKLSTDLSSGKFDNNKEAYLRAVSAVAPAGKVSGNFTGSISDLGMAMFNTRQAKLQLDQAAKNQQSAANQANQASNKLDGAENSVTVGKTNVVTGKSQTFTGKYADADKSLRQAESMRDQAKKLVAESQTLAGGANKDLVKASSNLAIARKLISDSNALISGVEKGRFGVDLKPITGNARKENSAQSSRAQEIGNNIANTQSQLNSIKARTQNVQQSIQSLSGDISSAQQVLDKERAEQMKKIREDLNGNFLGAQNWTIGTENMTGIEANKAINDDYNNLDKEFSDFMNFQGDDFVANWMSFGKFASREAGTQIQSLETSLEALNTLSNNFDGNSQNDIRALNSVITVMDADPMVKQSILMSAASMGIKVENRSSTEIMGDLLRQTISTDGVKKIKGVINDLGQLHNAMVKGNTEIHANIAPAYKIFLRAEKEGKDGLAALKEAGYGNVTGETFVLANSRDPQGLVLAGFQDYKKAQELESQAKVADKSGNKQDAARLRKERDAVMYNGSLKFGAQEQMAILQQPAIFGNPRVANILKAMTGTMSIKDTRSADGSYRDNKVKPEGQGTGWADFTARMGLREAVTPLEKEKGLKITNEKGETKLYVPSGTTDEMIRNGQMTKGSDGTITNYFYNNNNNKNLSTNDPRDMKAIYRSNVEGKLTIGDRIYDAMPGSTVIPVTGTIIRTVVSTSLPKQVIETFVPAKP